MSDLSRNARVLKIGEYTVGPGHPCFVIAETGVNHNGDAALALELVDRAAEARATAVKFQTFRADRLATPSAPKAAYQQSAATPGESQHEMLRRLELPAEVYAELVDRCRETDIMFLSSPFDAASVDFLRDLDMAAFKVPSGEITNLPLLCHIAATGKPVILSTGMATLPEVEAAVGALRDGGAREVALLHCVSEYPAPPSTVNLRAMKTLSDAFAVPVGYSDHTEGTAVSLAAAAMGACIIEKHFTVDRTLSGPDHAASLEPDEFAAMVRHIRTIETAMGSGEKIPTPGELEIAAVVRKSLVAACDIDTGTLVAEDMVDVKRPGNGLPPSMLSSVVGRRVTARVPKGTLLSLEMME